LSQSPARRFELASQPIFGQAETVSEPQPDIAPVELRVARRGAALVLVWPNGARSELDATALRRACRCAACTAAGAIGRAVALADDPAITAVEPIGAYAITIAFSDGHARGIYPWALLRELGGF
jgi:DUF971 family protein